MRKTVIRFCQAHWFSASLLAAMVLASGAGIAFAVQLISRPFDFWVALLPLNMVFITVRTVRALK